MYRPDPQFGGKHDQGLNDWSNPIQGVRGSGIGSEDRDEGGRGVGGWWGGEGFPRSGTRARHVPVPGQN